jgi:hypothetical protein
MGLKGTNNCLPRVLEGLHAFAQCAVLCFASSVRCPLFGAVGIRSWWMRRTRAKGSIFGLEFTYAGLQGGKMCFALVAAILSCNSVAVGAGLLAFLSSHVRPRPLTRRGAILIGCGCGTRFCCRLGGSGRRKGWRGGRA